MIMDLIDITRSYHDGAKREGPKLPSPTSFRDVNLNRRLNLYRFVFINHKRILRSQFIQAISCLLRQTLSSARSKRRSEMVGKGRAMNYAWARDRDCRELEMMNIFMSN